MRASYLEIYNEEIRDLLGNDTKQRLEVSLKKHCRFNKQNRIHCLTFDAKPIVFQGQWPWNQFLTLFSDSEHSAYVLCTILYTLLWWLKSTVVTSPWDSTCLNKVTDFDCVCFLCGWWMPSWKSTQSTGYMSGAFPCTLCTAWVSVRES